MLFKVSCNLNHSDSVTTAHRAAQGLSLHPGRCFTPLVDSHPVGLTPIRHTVAREASKPPLVFPLPDAPVAGLWSALDAHPTLGLHLEQGRRRGALSGATQSKPGSSVDPRACQLRAMAPALSPGHPSVWLHANDSELAAQRH